MRLSMRLSETRCATGSDPVAACQRRPGPRPAARSASSSIAASALLFANRLLLDLVDYDDVGQIAAEGGLVRLFRGSPSLLRSDGGRRAARPVDARDESIAVEVRLATVRVGRAAGEPDAGPQGPGGRRDRAPARGRGRSARARGAASRELDAILDTATDGVIVVRRDRAASSPSTAPPRRCSATTSARWWATPSRCSSRPRATSSPSTTSTACASPGVASLLNDGREVHGPGAPGRRHPALHDDGPRRATGRTASSAPCCATSPPSRRRRASSSRPSAPRRRRARRNPIFWPRSATRSARRSTPSSASPR